MNTAIMARLSIWLFFILIVDPLLMLGSLKFSLPLHPAFFYLPIATGLLCSALARERSLADLKEAWLFFAAFSALAVLGVLIYRGENVGPDFGAMLLELSQRPSSLGYAVWPMLNLVAAARLFLLARRSEFRRTIIHAAFTALILQVATMEADMWWPALFGDANGRAGGVAQNANDAALLVVVLAAITLSTRLVPYAITLATAGVLLSQSKAGGIADLALVGCFLFTSRGKSVDRWSLSFAGAVVLMLAGTVYFSPVLNPLPDQIEEGKQLAQRALTYPGRLPPAVLDEPVKLVDRIAERASIDELANLRSNALAFFFDIFKENPFGLGTGFSNKFVTGPHNTWLKLAVDEGILAPVLLLVMLAAAGWRAVKSRSPELSSIVLVALIASPFYHTLFVDPLLTTVMAAATGMTAIKSGDHPTEDRN